MATFNRLTKQLAVVAVLVLTASNVMLAQGGGGGTSGISSFLSAVNSIGDEVTALKAEKKISPNDIHIVDVQKLRNPGNSAVLDKAIARNKPKFHDLHEALEDNAIIMAALKGAGVSEDDVIALDVVHGGEVRLFYQKGS